jgi:hypothetical protein
MKENMRRHEDDYEAKQSSNGTGIDGIVFGL